MELGVHAGATGVLREPVKAIRVRQTIGMESSGKNSDFWMDQVANIHLLESTISGFLNNVEHDLQPPGTGSLRLSLVPRRC
eukprot:315796-Hanusia_phi.AAC.1